MTSMHGRVALVTGGGRGIGRATALELARRGADVAVAARNAGEIEEVAAAIREHGRRTLAVPVDPDTLPWSKEQGDSAQEQMSAALRIYAEEQKVRKSSGRATSGARIESRS